MAAPTYPAVVLDDDAGTATYQSLDHVDEALYNSFHFVYQRAVFQKLVALRLAEGIVFTNGNDIQVLWDKKPSSFMKKWKKKSSRHRPVEDAEPPVVPAVPAPAVVAPTTAPSIRNQTIGDLKQAHAPTHQDQSNAAATPQGPDSPETLAAGSPVYVLENSTQWLSPTRGEREFVRSSLGNRGWKFVKVLDQRALDKDRKRTDRALHPYKNFLLYVRPNEYGNIEDVGFDIHFTIAFLLTGRQQIVVKRVDISGDGDHYWAKNEISMNIILAQTRCSHIIEYRGDGLRTTRKKVLLWLGSTEAQPDTQRISHLYFQYAAYGDLDATIQAHAAREIPVPEHFIWYLISQMIEAISAFQEGLCEHPHPEITGAAIHEPEPPLDSNRWDPLLHSDIKHHNIFCCDDNTIYPSYPRPVLADFDIVQSSSNISRHSGTPGWQAPERYTNAADYANYRPNDWDVTVKAEIWAVGVVAYRLLWAGKGTDAVIKQKDDIMQETEAWQTRFGKPKLPKDLGGLYDDFQEPPDIYSSGLVHLVQRCLNYRPENRPGLPEMKNIVDAKLRRLDLLYGDEIKKVKEAIAEPHKVWSSAVGEPAKRFAIGSRYDPPRKRRRVNLDDSNSLAYQAIVDDWVVTMSSPQPSLASQAKIVDAMMNSADKSDNDDIRFLMDDDNLRHSFHYLISCLSTRVAPDAPVHYVKDWGEEVQETFMSVQDSLRRGYEDWAPVPQRVLPLIVQMIPEFRDNRAYHDLQEAINVLEHAVKWSLALLQYDAEPRTPLLEKKTEMHRGFRDWIFIHPHPAE
ncbi:hypothetical protein HBI73_126440 [Parastagonospora nodorum]|nr:hypothetical protein HBI73_126440 [Parastagonospora nodorum]KAH5315073.1 hypothetical protein HBI12_131420 [Parastagonospora nodorum]KAH5373426.1 hypothetical protein HBI48_017120 [Parastagonospora nodorum]